MNRARSIPVLALALFATAGHARMGLDAAIARAEYTFQEGSGGTWAAPNRAQGLRVDVTAEGIRVEPRVAPDWRLGLAVRALGRDGALVAVPAGSVHAAGTRVAIVREGFEEWYVNGPRGIEQGFTLMRRPSGSAESAVVIQMSLDGGLLASRTPDGTSVLFRTASGAPVLRYSGLRVEDASGAPVSARIRLGIGRLEIHVDDRGAAYPLEIDPLITDPSFVFEADQPGALLGSGVAVAGDVNGDGFSDLLVGSPGFDGGQVDEGKAFLFLGSVSGLQAPAAWAAEGNQPGAQLGQTVAPAGDVDGDGFADLLVGAPGFDGAHVDAGRVLLHRGSATGPSPGPSWTLDGGQAGAHLGAALAGGGDIDADGFDDVLLGEPGFDGGQVDEGRALVFLGSTSGLASTPAWTAEPDQAGADFGRSVGLAGDVDADGFMDVAVGAPLFNGGETDEGRALLYRGSAGGPTATASWTAEWNQRGAHLGHVVAGVGDVDGDGYADLAVSAPEFTQGERDEGRVALYPGSASGPSATPAWTAESDQPVAGFGRSLAPAGDVNGDGYADLVVGAPGWDGGQQDEGRAYAYLGSAAGPALAPSWTFELDQPGASVGESVAAAGDVDGDGFGEVAVGMPRFDGPELDEGRVAVFGGSGAGPADTPAWSTDGTSSPAGQSLVTPAGDVNGDGYADILVGVPLYDGGTGEQGAVFLFTGSPDRLSQEPQQVLLGTSASRFGEAVASAGDVDGDGSVDVVVTEPGRQALHVFAGGELGLGAAPLSTLIGPFSIGTLASAGDVNGDGRSDVLVGQPEHGGCSQGRVLLYLGQTGGLPDSPSWTAVGERCTARLGASVAGAGDVNGDGYGDVVAGGHTYANDTFTEGHARLWHGSPAGLSSVPDWSVEPDVTSYFGRSVAGAGDVDADGYSDVLVGAPHQNGVGAWDGRAYLYFGSGTGLSTTPGWTWDSGQNGAEAGDSVASAGDVNGDGYSDVLVGAYRFGGFDAGRAFLFLGSAGGPPSEPSWSADGGEFDALLGRPVAPAGDVDGDGFGDVLVGAPGKNRTGGGSGVAFLFHGNEGPGLDRRLRQRRVDGAGPVAQLGVSDSGSGFRVDMLGRTPSGRGTVALEIEAKPLGVPFDAAASRGAGMDTGAPGIDGSTVLLDEIASGLQIETAYRWRARIVSDAPLFPRTPWSSVGLNAPTETDLRTTCDKSPLTGSPLLSVDRDALSWTALETATAYDVLRGNLGLLRESSGDFSQSLSGCLVSRWPDLTLPYPYDPYPGQGDWYLVRGFRCGVNGTYDEGGRQAEGRDAQIEATPGHCP